MKKSPKLPLKKRNRGIDTVRRGLSVRAAFAEFCRFCLTGFSSDATIKQEYVLLLQHHLVYHLAQNMESGEIPGEPVTVKLPY